MHIHDMNLSTELLLPSYTVSLAQQTPIVQPQFSRSIYEASVNESNVAEGFPLPEDGFLVVQCSPDNTTYSISDPENAGPFTIDSDTGSLSASTDVDYEQDTSYQFIVSCTDVNNASLTDTAEVNITVQPVNEFRPRVSPSTILLTLNEFTPIGTVLISSIPSSGAWRIFTVSDRDQGPDSTISYTFPSTNVPRFVSPFDLDPNTGTLSLNQTLDRDAADSLPLIFSLVITVCDINPPVDNCPNIAVTVFVLESNDNPPIFSQDNYTVTVSESFPINEVIATVTCTDADPNTGAFDGFTISSVAPEGTPNVTFSIDGNSGNITLRRPLDYEFSQVYEISVLCLDNMGLQDNATVVVMVTDINDNPPTVVTFFDDEIRVSDGSPVGTNVLKFQCTDVDSIENANITYSIDTNDAFEIDDITGNMTVAAPLTLPENFTMDVIISLECSDQGMPPLTDNLTIVIEIYKDDTTPPIINNSSISDGFLNISEGVELGSVLLQVVATDPTSPGLVYTIRNESILGVFIIDSESGVVTVNQSLDREVIDTYTFVVVVTEVRIAPGDPRSVEAEIMVEILDINDNIPMFSDETYPVTLQEDIAIGDTVAVVMCSDLDIKMNIEYEITDSFPNGTFPNTFAINGTDGEISLLLPLDYELSPVYTIDVVCSDSGGFQDNAMVLITVTDINDNSPEIITFFDNIILQVNDQSEVGFVIDQFQCTDADSNENGNITYSINPNDFFLINEITGMISVSTSLVLADNTFYTDGNITVYCTDQGNSPLSNSSMVFYRIYKDDSTPPLINATLVSDGFISISESAPIGTELAQVTAIDTTSPDLIFSLINESSPIGAFVIDSTTGVITVAQRLDRERFDVHNFIVVVTEVRVAPGAPQSDEIEFTVMIIDINDNPPTFSRDVYNVTRPESFAVNDTIATVLCTDPDINENGTFSGYQISGVVPSGVAQDTFSIDNSTGNITLLRALDYEFSVMYSINLICFDNEGMQDTARVDIHLEDVNDNYPVVITFFPDPVPIKDSEMLGYVLRQFRCTDSDSRENGNVTYSFGNPSPPFLIDPISGNIIVTSPLTLGSGTFFRNLDIILVCSDQGDSPQSNSTMIFIRIFKDDTTAPVINPASISNGLASISEGAEIGQTLLQVEAIDTTSPGLRFELRSESSPGTFIIDADSGRITVGRSLDRETVTMYSFQLVVTEVLVDPFTAPARLVRTQVDVMILDENDNRPQCNNGADLVKYVLVGNYSFNNSLNVADIMCTDLDAGENAEITLVSVNFPQVSDGAFTLNTTVSSNGGFAVNATSGRVIFTGALSKNATYTMMIRASDQGVPPLSTSVNVTLIVTGEIREEFTELERMLLIIVPSVSGGLLLCACLIIFCMCCWRCRKKKKAKDYYSTIRYYMHAIKCHSIISYYTKP